MPQYCSTVRANAHVQFFCRQMPVLFTFFVLVDCCVQGLTKKIVCIRCVFIMLLHNGVNGIFKTVGHACILA